MWPPFASRSATHLLRIELFRLLIVACAMLVHSSSIAVRSCWILAGTGTRCHIRRSRASQTCSMGDMSGEYAGHARTGMFSRNCVQILATWGRALPCFNIYTNFSLMNGSFWMWWLTRWKMIGKLWRVWQFKWESTHQFWSTSHMQVVVVQTADNCTYCLHTCAKAFAICLNQ